MIDERALLSDEALWLRVALDLQELLRRDVEAADSVLAAAQRSAGWPEFVPRRFLRSHVGNLVGTRRDE